MKPSDLLSPGLVPHALDIRHDIAACIGQLECTSSVDSATAFANFLHDASNQLIFDMITLTVPTSSFASNKVTKLSTDAAFTNVFTTNSDGAVTFTTSDPDVATVNSTTGQVTIKGKGRCWISATSAASATYAGWTKRFKLDVN